MAAMGEDLERLKQRIPLLKYLQRHHWTDTAPALAPSSSDTVPYMRKPILPSISTLTRICSTVTAAAEAVT